VADASLRDEVDRAAAAVGLPTVGVTSPAALGRAGWSAALAVVLDARAAEHGAAAGLPRRPGVVVVTVDTPTAADFHHALAVGAHAVLPLPAGAGELVAALSAAGHRPTSDTGPLCAVLGGRGGAGASVFAVALARRAASALLVDLDPHGGGLDLLAGSEDAPGLRWPDLSVRGGRVDWDSLAHALPSDGTVTVLSAARRGGRLETGAVESVLDAGRSGGVAVVCDLPRSMSDAAVVALTAADLVAVVCPADVRSCAAAAALVPDVTALNPNTGVVVRGPSPGGLRAEDVAGLVGAPLLAAMRPEPLLAERLERGGLRLRARSPLSVAAARVWSVVARHRAAVAA
jgi:secretion/DNA translocation related CpaE-like protein